MTPEAVENSVLIAKRCSYRVKPIDPLLPNFTRGMDVSEAEMLRQETIKGLELRLDLKAEQEELIRGKEEILISILENRHLTLILYHEKVLYSLS